MKVLLERQTDKRAQAEDFSVREIYYSRGGKDHDETYGEKTIDQADGQTIQNLLPKHTGLFVGLFQRNEFPPDNFHD